MSHDAKRPRLLEERATLNRISIVFTVGEPVIYQQQGDPLA